MVGKIKKMLFNRIVFVGLALVFQIALIVAIILQFRSYVFSYYVASVVINIVTVLLVINNDMGGGYKVAWLILILVVPFFGGLFYLMFGGKRLSKKVKRRMSIVNRKMEQALLQNYTLLHIEDKLSRGAIRQSNYIKEVSYCPIYKDTYTEYFPTGEKYFERLLEELKKAEKYIFLEYFIIDEGIIWNRVLNILEDKVKEGVDVRVMYDDIGCITTLPYNYDKVLESKGIKAAVFNPFKPVLSSRLNNRNHRKIVVIDGEVGFTGGINIGDEYANLYERFGNWKDTGIMLKGEAVWSFTVMFLSVWDYIKDLDENFNDFRPKLYKKYKAKGFVQPYTDNPLDNEALGEIIYLNLINRAREYVYINTPYLIVDNEMIIALCTAAKSGVDVRITTPGVPDKKMVFLLTRSYYGKLLESGVKIYEYTPGFNHAKSFVVDDKYAVVGTVNLDYRSLYLHYECGVWMYNTDIIPDIKKDYLETVNVSRLVDSSYIGNVSILKLLAKSFLRVLAPLM